MSETSSPGEEEEFVTIPSSQNPHSSSHFEPDKKKPKLSTVAEATTGATEDTEEVDSESSISSHVSGDDMPALEGEEDMPKLSAADRRMMKKIAKVQQMNRDELGEVTEEAPDTKATLLDAFVTQTEPELMLAISGDEIPEEGKNFGDLMEDPAADALLLTRFTDTRRYKITAAAVAREWQVSRDNMRMIATDTAHLNPVEVAQQLAAQDYSVRSTQVLNIFTFHLR